VEAPLIEARRYESGHAWTQQISWIPDLDEAESVSNHRMGDLERKSKRAMRP
jgi:hypothetical protein